MAGYDFETRELFAQEHREFRATVRDFTARHVAPHIETWDKQGRIDRGTWIEAGKLGLLGIEVDSALGGGGSDDYAQPDVGTAGTGCSTAQRRSSPTA